jgi:competence protein ComEA
MEAAASPASVATASRAPPAWPQDTQWTTPPANTSVALPGAAPPVWTRPAQVTTAVLLCLALGLLAWHAYGSHRIACRPATLEPGGTLDLRIDLNRADHAQLLQLPGVGEALVKRIEEYRRERKGFRSVDELRKVGGIGPALLERMRPYLYVEVDESEVAKPTPAPIAKQPPPAAGSKRKDGGEELIDVNTATAAQLQTLPGIGPKMAERILDARARQPFRTVEDLRRVSGIGPKTLERLRPLVTVGEELAPFPKKD